MDLFRCPVADFFRREDAADVCVGSWCTLDDPLAGSWGGRCEREGTLAAGDPACRMRWTAKPAYRVAEL